MPRPLASALSSQHRLLRGLLATGAGYARRSVAPWRACDQGPHDLSLLYCVDGQGWCRLGKGAEPVRAGELLVLSPQTSFECGADPTRPWTIHWGQATGDLIPDYIAKLTLSRERAKLWIGDDLQVVFLFQETLMSLGRSFAFPDVLRASHALGLLLARCIARTENPPGRNERSQKIGECIEFMSEHLDEALKVGQLARLANLSPAHFAVVFKEQTGTTPREYLHLLRMHRAREWLFGTRMPLKEIAGRLGYQDQFHFSRKFKAFSGLSPSRYRERR